MYGFKNSSVIYIKSFCGEDNFLVWDDSHHNFGLCFQKSILCGLSFSLLAIFSAFYTGKQTALYIRSKSQKAIIILRLLITLGSFLLAVLMPCLLSFYSHVQLYWVDIFASSVQVLAWVVHIMYLLSLRFYLSRGTRGPRPVIASWVLTLLCSIFSAKTAWSITSFPKTKLEIDLASDMATVYLLRWLVTVQLSLQVVYLVTLFPRGRCDARPLRGYSREDERTPLLDTSYPVYSRFRESFDPFDLGVAEEGVNKLSYLTFYWVNLLMEKGYQRRLEAVDDLYDLPNALRCEGGIDEIARAENIISNKLRMSYESDLQMFAPQTAMFPGLHPMAMMSTVGFGLPRSGGPGNMGMYGSSPSSYPPLYPTPIPGQGPAQQSNEDVDAFQETAFLFIPNSAVGAIIGTKGSHIRNLIRFSGANIKIAPLEEGKEISEQMERRVTIVGTPEAQWKAQYLIFDKIREEGYGVSIEDVRLTVEMNVPSSQVGRIIGKGGQNVRDLQRQTGSLIKLPQQGSSTSDDTTVQISGSFYSIQSAQRRIRAILAGIGRGNRPLSPRM